MPRVVVSEEREWESVVQRTTKSNSFRFCRVNTGDLSANYFFVSSAFILQTGGSQLHFGVKTLQ
jgi:hypothetical protein